MNKLKNILLKARDLVEDNEWEKLEKYADNHLNDVIDIVEKYINKYTDYVVTDDERWKYFLTLTGSHSIHMEFTDVDNEKHEFKMSLNLTGDHIILVMK